MPVDLPASLSGGVFSFWQVAVFTETLPHLDTEMQSVKIRLVGNKVRKSPALSSLVFVCNHVHEYPYYVSYKREDIMWKSDAETDSSIIWWCATNNYFYTAIKCASQPASDCKLRLETNGWQLVFALMSWSALRSLNPFLQHWATDLYFAGFRSVLLNKPRALTGDYCRIYYTHLNWLLFTSNACIDLKVSTLTVIFHFKCPF